MPFSALWTELKPKGLSLLELSTEKNFIITSLKINLFFHIGNSICLYSAHFPPHFPPVLNILEGILILKFCSKGIFKLEIAYFCSHWHVLYNSSRKLKGEDILGSNSQPSKLANTGRKLFIYLSFIPSVLPSLFLHHFLSFHSCSLIYFLFAVYLIQEEFPTPSH